MKWFGLSDGFWGALISGLLTGGTAIFIMLLQNSQLKKERKRSELIPTIKLAKQLEYIRTDILNALQLYLKVITPLGYTGTPDNERDLVYNDILKKLKILNTLVNEYHAKDIDLDNIINYVLLKEVLNKLNNDLKNPEIYYGPTSVQEIINNIKQIEEVFEKFSEYLKKHRKKI
ncbi:hypothetical protein [Rossellomorea sp. DUT-2]|uniref:hypothetical protein n=1 Tax=Rossellomorea sp. DUT-2 TaxID=3412021 RepID=UPI003D165BAD